MSVSYGGHVFDIAYLLGVIADIVAQHGAEFAFPTQTIHMNHPQIEGADTHE